MYCYFICINTIFHFIKKEILDDIVKLEIERQAKLALKECDKDELLRAADRRKETERRCEEADKKIDRLKEELSTVQKYKKKTYENFVDGILNKEEYDDSCECQECICDMEDESDEE